MSPVFHPYRLSFGGCRGLLCALYYCINCRFEAIKTSKLYTVVLRDMNYAAGGFAAWQQYLIRYREREACFKAFLNNNWFGAVVFLGILVDYLVRN